jgi:heme-degrading monooxygenase HmoA
VFHILWQFDVAPDRVEAFEAAYGPDGGWDRLFAEGSGYAGTELFRRTGTPPSYLTLDRWTSRAEYEAFHRARAAEYSTLDAACEGLTEVERFLGAWED